jgi:formyl-CoA transferase
MVIHFTGQHLAQQATGVLDLRKQEARDVIARLAAQCDIVRELSARALEKWGLQIRALMPVNPKLIMVTRRWLCGQSGPYR